MAHNPNRRVRIALGLAGLALLAVTWDLWSATRTTPAILRFVPPKAQAYVATGPLRDLWLNGSAHLPFQTSPDDKSGETVENIKRDLAKSCVVVNTPDDLRMNGLDETRGALFAVIDPRAPNYVAVVPVHHKDRALTLFSRLDGPAPAPLVLSVAEQGAAAVTRILIAANASVGVSFCGRDGAPKLLDEGASLEVVTTEDRGAVSLNVVTDGTHSSPKIDIECYAEHDDGSRSPCICRVGDHECKEAKLKGAHSLEQARLENGHEIEFYRFSSNLLVAFPEQGTALLADSVVSLQAALNEAENLAFFRADDSLAVVQKRLFKDFGQGDAVVYGSFSLPLTPFSGNTHFSMIFDQGHIRVEALFPVQTLQTTILERIMAPNPQRAMRNPVNSRVEIGINDAALGYYVRYARKYIDRADDKLRRAFGNLFAFVDQLTELDSVGVLTLSVQGLEDGVPNLVFALQTEQQTSDDIIFRQRVRLRTARDIAILSAAAKDPHAASTDVDGIVAVLAPEQNSFFDRYTIINGERTSETELKLQAPPFEPEAFRNESYQRRIDGRLYEFLSPAIGDNDLLFRDLIADPSLDIEALRAGRFRPVATYDEKHRQLLVGTDLTALTDYLARRDEFEGSAPASKQSTSKLAVTGNVQWLVGQALLYPNADLRKAARSYFVSFQRYRNFDMHFEVLPRDQLLIATLRMDHD